MKNNKESKYSVPKWLFTSIVALLIALIAVLFGITVNTYLEDNKLALVDFEDSKTVDNIKFKNLVSLQQVDSLNSEYEIISNTIIKKDKRIRELNNAIAELEVKISQAVKNGESITVLRMELDSKKEQLNRYLEMSSRKIAAVKDTLYSRSQRTRFLQSELEEKRQIQDSVQNVLHLLSQKCD